MMKLAILISNIGTGTNLQAIIDGVESGKIKASITAVVSDTPLAPGLERAKKHKLRVKISPKKENLLPLLKKLSPDYICLAGWKQIILDEVIAAFPNRIINTHPGLIPDTIDGIVKNPDGTNALWNKGKMTDKAMQSFLESKTTYAGCTNHFLSHEFDFGTVLGRCFEKIRKGDTADSLYTRLKVKENKLYADVLEKLCNKGKNVLIIGGGGREHALAEKYSQSKYVNRVFIAPGNGLTDYLNKKIITVPEIQVLNFAQILKLIKKENIELVDVAQDDPLAAGLVDVLEVEKIKAFGPTQSAAEIEWNKIWSRNFMDKYNLPVPRYVYFSNTEEAKKYINTLPEQTLYIKAAGLAAGKGAIKTDTKSEAINTILSMKHFGKAGEKFLIEEALEGEEFSAFAISDGNAFQIVGFAQDHKRVNDGDKGENTGGMGCVNNPLIVKNVKKQIEDIFRKTFEGFQKENRPYKGVLYLGGIVVGKKVYVIEFNARWGDPEAEVILPSIQNDFLDLAEAIVSGNLKKIKIKVDKKVRVAVAAVAKGYPVDYKAVKGKKVLGIGKALETGVKIYGAGIKKVNGEYVVNGGRVLFVVGEGKDVIEARDKAYKAISKINIEGNNLHFRKDIGWRDVERMRERTKK